MLPSIHSIVGDAYVFQQDSAPAHHVHQTVKLLQCETPKFITPDLWPPNSPHLNPVHYRIWGVMQDCVCQMPFCIYCPAPEHHYILAGTHFLGTYCRNTHTNNHLTAFFPGHSGFCWSKRWWGGSGISWTICKSFAPCSRQITTPAPHHSILQEAEWICMQHVFHLVKPIIVCYKMLYVCFRWFLSYVNKSVLWSKVGHGYRLK